MKLNWNDSRKPPAVVIGLNINGLGTVRALGRKGIPVIALAHGNKEPSEYTKYCEKIVLEDLYTSEHNLLSHLVEIGKKLPSKSVVFPAGDLPLLILSKNRKILEEYYYFPFPEDNIVRLINDKVLFYNFAYDNGFPIAKTYFPDNREDAERVADEITYPCIIKPHIAFVKWRKKGLKLLQADDKSELLEKYEFGYNIADKLVIQEVIPGPDSALYFSLTYFNRQIKPLVMFTGRKLRQYVPHFGISSMAQSVWCQEIADKTVQILKKIGYSGYANIEFKKDPRDNVFKITEITGRTWYPHALSERCGINIPYIAYCDLLGMELRNIPNSFLEDAKWIDEAGDFLSASIYWRRGELSITDWIKSYKGKRFYAIFSRDDPKPGIIFIIYYSSLLIRKCIARILKVVKK